MEDNKAMSKIIIEVKDLKKEFQVGDEIVRALRGINLAITEGEFIAIMGASGSGKSTMLNILGCHSRHDFIEGVRRGFGYVAY